jgi:L-rhamnose mutarotase
MRRGAVSLLAAGMALPAILLPGLLRRRHAQRIGMVIGMRPDRISAYEALHAASNPGVRDLLARYHLHNFSIFLHQLDSGQYYLFGYYEYTGNDYRADMEKLDAEPRNQEWLRTTDPMQIPLPGENTWSTMREVYYNP